MLELAQDYIDEGTAAGVRGDIAFAQSILETGSFYFPDGGQLTPQDNNFAGMDALRQLRARPRVPRRPHRRARPAAAAARLRRPDASRTRRSTRRR